MTIGERIKQRRIELNMSQDDLARKMGYKTRNAIYQFEQKDNMKLSLVEKFATALDCSPSDLMPWEDKEEEEAKERFIKASIHGDKLNQLAEAYDRADSVTKGIVDKILGLALPDADLPRSPEDNG